jgi:hypothetical protein
LDELGIILYKRLNILPDDSTYACLQHQLETRKEARNIPIIKDPSLVSILDDVEFSGRTLSLEELLRFGDVVEPFELGADEYRQISRCKEDADCQSHSVKESALTPSSVPWETFGLLFAFFPRIQNTYASVYDTGVTRSADYTANIPGVVDAGHSSLLDGVERSGGIPDVSASCQSSSRPEHH